MLSNPLFIVVGVFGMVLNLLLSGGTLFKMIEFAKDYGAVKEKVRANSQEIEKLREFTHDLRDGKIPLAQHHK